MNIEEISCSPSGKDCHLDPCRLALEGTSFIEANAGCGKTRSLTDMYLRLVTEAGLLPRNIVVLSYTEAATQELKERLRQRLKEARRACEEKEGRDCFIEALLSRSQSSPAEVLMAITLALESFDEAAVYTIHGFCLKLLTDFSYETGGFGVLETIGGGDDLLREILQDRYRRLFYHQYPELVSLARSQGPMPDELLQIMRKVIQNPSLQIGPPPFGIKEEEIKRAIFLFREAFKSFCLSWSGQRKEAFDLLAHLPLHKTYFSPAKIKDIFDEVDYFLRVVEPIFPLPELLERLTETYLAKKIHRGNKAPQGGIFAAAEILLEAARSLEEVGQRFLHDRTLEIIAETQEELARRRSSSPRLSYTDLLLRVEESLALPQAPTLVAALRRNYRAVLVDEFQDTDSVQYAIIDRIFAEAGLPTFFIGDPKQAIYSFRGADVYAYLKAAGASRAKYRACVNYRSLPGLVRAVNVIFQKAPDPFVNEGIRYEPSLAGADLDGLSLEGKVRAPLQIWYLPGQEKEGGREEEDPPLNITAAKPRVARAVAEEIGHLLSLAASGRALIGNRPLTARDMAVLVRKRTEALLVMEALTQVGIPASLETAGSVYRTWEARQVEILLSALADPRDEGRVRAALTTVFFGRQAEAIYKMKETGEIRQGWLPRFQAWSEAACRSGLRYATHRILAENENRARILSLAKGLRVLTNTDHLLELLDSARLEKQLGLPALLGFLRNKIIRAPESDQSIEEKEHQLRLADDGHAVRIVTIHKSKGLEYPVVFCPFSWGSTKRTEKVRTYHHPETGRYQAYLGKEGMDPETEELIARESLSEECRLLYVALTRAKYRCYLAWGRFRGTAQSALAHLLHGGVMGGRDKFINDLEDLALANPGDIEVSLLPVGNYQAQAAVSLPRPDGLSRRRFYLTLDDSWQVTSATHIIAGQKVSLGDEGVINDEDEEGIFPELIQTGRFSSPPRGEEIFPREALPRGAATGILLHDILKNVDFQQIESDETYREVDRRLDLYGFPPSLGGEIMNVLSRAARTFLNQDGLKLSHIAPGDRIDEMPFYFPLKRWDKKSLMALFMPFGPSCPHYLAAGEKLPSLFRHGFMKGYVDLVFRWKDRYFLVDWKTNFLGEAREDYGREKLGAVMVKSLYVFQYLIYSLAVHRYLAARIRDYRYEEHFGGVYYLFLRGMDHLSPGGEGIFFDLPPARLIYRLDDYCGGKDHWHRGG